MTGGKLGSRSPVPQEIKQKHFGATGEFKLTRVNFDDERRTSVREQFRSTTQDFQLETFYIDFDKRRR